MAGWRAACEAAAKSVKDEAAAFTTLHDHASEGLRFYLGMIEVEKKCRQEADDFYFTRKVQRDELKQVRMRCKCTYKLQRVCGNMRDHYWSAGAGAHTHTNGLHAHGVGGAATC